MASCTLTYEEKILHNEKVFLYIMITVGLISYFLGTTQANVIVEVKEVEKVVEVVPDGHIALEHCIPLEDIACYYRNDSGYLCVELKDIQ